MPVINIGRASFRANPRYTLVLLDRLSPAEHELVGGPTGEPDLYGMLRPQPDSGPEIRSASADTALLFLTLATPGPLPGYFAARLGDEAERAIGRLVLDSVLEIEYKGHYLCGVQAGDLVAGGHSDAGHGRIGELSRAALRYGQELVGLPELLLARRLYGYGYRPVVTELQRQLDNHAAMAAYLGLDPGGSVGELLDASWHERTPQENGQRSNWRVWRPRPVMPAEPDPAGPSYKLYVSPVAGTAALVREYLTLHRNHVQDGLKPSGALIKAFLINGAINIGGQFAGEIPAGTNSVDGFGLLNLSETFQTGQIAVYSAVVADATKPMKITLAWTDPPSAAGAGGLQTQLYLRVQPPSGAALDGDLLAFPNAQNNVQRVVVTTPVAGTYQVQVHGVSVTVNSPVLTKPGVPKQDFAVVASNVLNLTAAAASTSTTGA